MEKQRIKRMTWLQEKKGVLFRALVLKQKAELGKISAERYGRKAAPSPELGTFPETGNLELGDSLRGKRNGK